ncbi:ABC transporter permease [Paenibacillus sp. SC116]|uniref:FtsX-like permease family protein n=1 Tax=Paenibacillus sp. SC116 TaxID=2968986 RepID=UPI00215B4F23|nr:ABC transporter permease [Paenibacillus sp. SC116]MCR8842715.1 ABC transporter permease [Paenibacillus sp. SC116]
MQSWRVSWRNIKDKRVRSILTILAIVIGVASTLATISMVKTTNNWIHSFTVDAYGRFDWFVSSNEGTFDERWIKELQATHGVESAVAEIAFVRPLERIEGNKKEALFENIRFIGVSDLASPILDLKVLEGQFTSSGLVVDQVTSQLWGVGVGDRIYLKSPSPNSSPYLEIAAIIENTSQLNNSRQASDRLYPVDVFVPLAVTQQLGNADEQVHTVMLRSDKSVSPDQINKNLQQSIASDSTLYVQRSVADTQLAVRGLGELYQALYVIGGLGLLIGSFIMYSTIYINVTERRREFSIMKAVGYTSFQIKAHILREVVLLTFIGSIIGVGVGAVLAYQLQEMLLNVFGNALPYEMVWNEAIILSLMAGILLPVIAVWSPVAKASETSVSYVLRRMDNKIDRTNGKITLIAGLLCIIGSFFITHMITFLPLFIGLALIFPYLFRGVHWLITPLNRFIFGREGSVASKQMMRTSHYFTMSSTILSFGITMLIYISALGSSFYSNLEQSSVMPVVTVKYANAISSQHKQELRQMQGVRQVTTYASYFLPWKHEHTSRMLELNSAEQSFIVNQDLTSELAQYTQLLESPNTIVLDAEVYREWGGKKGDTFELETPNGIKELIVVGTVGWGMANNNGFVSQRTLEESIGLPYHNMAILETHTPTELKDTLLAKHDMPIKSIETMSDIMFLSQQQLQKTFGIINLVVYLSIFIAAIGITNTMFMNTVEYARELGMMRAVGYTRWQIVKLLLSKAFIIGAIAAVIGIFAGLGSMYLTVIQGYYLHLPLQFIVPWKDVFIAGVTGIGISLLACLLPAYRAVKWSITYAMKYE